MAQVGELEYKLEDRDNKISEQETAIAALNRRIDNLKTKADASDKYRDDLYEAHRTIEKLSKAQNVVEKYRKKLEGMGELEQQVKTLDEQSVQMLKDLRMAEETAKQVPGLKRTIEQYKKQVAKLEGDCTELTRVKHQLQTEKQILLTKADGAEYQRTKDQERIRNLDERIRELESGLMSEQVEEYGSDLHSELAFSTKTKMEMSVRTRGYMFRVLTSGQAAQALPLRGRNPAPEGGRRRGIRQYSPEASFGGCD